MSCAFSVPSRVKALSALSPWVKLSLEQGSSLFQDETGVC